MSRAGQYVTQVGGYRAFIPSPLPPDPPLKIDDELLNVLSKADQALGRLDASADMLPNPDLFVSMYVRKEAVLSSQIEGTQASLTDVLEYEVSQIRKGVSPDIDEVVNYIKAMNYGLERLKALPLSNRLTREIHRQLLSGVRGEEKSPGEFRKSQNWIGGRNPTEALYVPPPPYEMEQALGDLEKYIHSDSPMPVLMKTGFIHSQFETIHPFLDGNGRMGRLLITFFLCQQGVLKRPLLYLSAYFKQHRDEYYNRLQAVRDTGDWEQWLKFFLTAIWRVSQEASATAQQILALRENHRQMIQELTPGSSKGLELLDELYLHPYTTVDMTATDLKVSYPTANTLIGELVFLGILTEITGRQRNRVFVYEQYLDLLKKGTEASIPDNRT
jgi:Fic family protein